MKKTLIVIAMAALAAATLLWCNAQSTNSPPKKTSEPMVCDNGLKAWRDDTNHTFGVWLANSTRIVKNNAGKYQPQFKDCKDTNAVWSAIFEGDKAYDDLFWAQYHLKRAFEIKKGVVDAFEDLGRKDAKAP